MLRHLDRCQPLYFIGRERNGTRFRWIWIAINDAGMNCRAYEIFHQLRSAVRSRKHQLWIKPFFEAAGRIGTQPQYNRGTPDVRGLEVGSFKQHGCRRIVDLADAGVGVQLGVVELGLTAFLLDLGFEGLLLIDEMVAPRRP